MDFRSYCCAPMLDRSPVILWYRLTIPWESWFTVVMRASPTAATIKAYSTRSCPCSSRIKQTINGFIVPLRLWAGSGLNRVRPRIFQRSHEKPVKSHFPAPPVRFGRLHGQRGRVPVQTGHQFQVLERGWVRVIVTQCYL